MSREEILVCDARNCNNTSLENQIISFGGFDLCEECACERIEEMLQDADRETLKEIFCILFNKQKKCKSDLEIVV